MNNHDIIPAHLAVKAMRDNGYKNAAYAIAELMDNSMQAGATQVELLCAERGEVVTQRRRTRIDQLAVLDNGSGMDASTLRIALQFGNGTHLTSETQKGIGRFGMGLPSSSVSQARRVDVWSWQNGPDQALHTYLDIGEVERGKMREVPEPESKPIPDIWRKAGQVFGQSGTLVVWSDLDRCQWRTAKTIIDNSELLIGRMYRFFLSDGRVRIRYHWFDIDRQGLFSDENERYALPNDPIYMMSRTSCPAPFDDQPMFEQWGDDFEYRIRYKGEVHSVWLRFAHAREDARRTDNAGALPHGRHAAKNLGVSIVRAERELDLDAGWTNSYDPTERWWGVEVHFPPALDEIFGVTNNKQAARYFSEMAKVDLTALMDEYESYSDMVREMNADQDPRIPLIEIAKKITDNIKSIRDLVKAQSKGLRTQKRHQEERPTEQRATDVTRQRIEEGYKGESDRQEETMTPAQREQEIKAELIEQGTMVEVAEKLAAQTVGRGLKYQFNEAAIGGPSFFDVKSRGGTVIVTLNTRHPAHQHLLEVLESDDSQADEAELRSRLARARDGIELLLMAWARYEDEEPEGKRRDAVQKARWEWGSYARQFLSDDDEA